MVLMKQILFSTSPWVAEIRYFIEFSPQTYKAYDILSVLDLRNLWYKSANFLQMLKESFQLFTKNSNESGSKVTLQQAILTLSFLASPF